MWMDGNTVPSTERSSRLRKERATHCILWNLNANAGFITVLRVVLPLFSVELIIIPRGLFPHSPWYSTTVVCGTLLTFSVFFVIILCEIVPSWKTAYCKRPKKGRRNASWVGMPETLNDCNSSRTFLKADERYKSLLSKTAENALGGIHCSGS